MCQVQLALLLVAKKYGILYPANCTEVLHIVPVKSYIVVSAGSVRCSSSPFAHKRLRAGARGGRAGGHNALPPRVGRVLQERLGRGHVFVPTDHEGFVEHQAGNRHEGACFALPELLLLLLAAGDRGT